ncbi:fumarylacetoacetate hydrolase family protein [Blastomonas fulva]|jgi:2-keto-4-pentenoate hydratase/2-oxohepta-3-ene-1,7-dioic acid hydratase in catechol pathway|uniref:fumarylacetoacetate hydrolase family protein n=1 Tax=Blastomonas fulva TaxID=1550728 RepID=UPI003D2E1B75
MKLVRFGEKGRERPGVVDADGVIRDVSHLIEDLTGANLLASLATLRAADLATAPVADGDPRLGVPLTGIGKILAIGRNYAEHAAETGNTVLEEPIVFSKAISSLNGPNDPVVIPKNSRKSDWEVELGVVIGKVARYVSEDEALDYIAGYCVVNDVSEREFQLERSGQWVKGKSCDTFAPVGPWLVTPDEIADPQNLSLSTTVNGQRYQDGNTRDMVFGVAYLIHYLSQFMSLQPGDVIATGTPSGIGMALKPPVFLKPGDVMEIEVEGLGRQRQDVVAFDPTLFA